MAAEGQTGGGRVADVDPVGDHRWVFFFAQHQNFERQVPQRAIGDDDQFFCGVPLVGNDSRENRIGKFFGVFLPVVVVDLFCVDGNIRCADAFQYRGDGAMDVSSFVKAGVLDRALVDDKKVVAVAGGQRDECQLVRADDASNLFFGELGWEGHFRRFTPECVAGQCRFLSGRNRRQFG